MNRTASGSPSHAGTVVRPCCCERENDTNEKTVGKSHDHTRKLQNAALVRVHLLRELAETREPLVATHLSFPSVCHVAVAGDAFRWVPAHWEY